MAKKLIVHCGAHKTATSSLQYFFSKNSTWLLERGIKYLEPKLLNEKGIPQFLRGETPGSALEIDSQKRLFSSLMTDKQTDTFLISHESFFSYAGNPLRGRIYPTLETGLEKFKQLPSFFDEVTFLFCIRESASFLESIFLQNFGIVYAGEFEDFFNGIDLIHVSWLPILQTLEHGVQHVTFKCFPYETLADRGAGFFLQLVLSHIGVEVHAPSQLPSLNESLSHTAIKMLQAQSDEFMSLDVEKRRAEKNRLKKEFPSAKHGRARLLTDRQKSLVRDILHSDNKKIFEHYLPEFALDLWYKDNI